MLEYPQAFDGGVQISAHRLVAKRALGEELPKGAVIHHVDGNVKNFIGSNLVICPDQAYHKLLHMREAALDACGNANWLRCKYCKKYDAPDKLVSMKMSAKPSPRTFHLECNREYQRSIYVPGKRVRVRR